MAGGMGVLLINSLACDPTSHRPLFRPLPQALVDTVSAHPRDVIRDLSARLESEGLTLRRVSPRDGFLETRGFDVAARVTRDVDIRDPTRVFVIRIWADSLPGVRSLVTAEAAYRRTSDPSQTMRQSEVMAQPEHAGRQLVVAVIQATKAHFRGQ